MRPCVMPSKWKCEKNKKLPLLPRRKKINLTERTKRKCRKSGRRKLKTKLLKERENPKERKRIIFSLYYQTNEAKGRISRWQ